MKTTEATAESLPRKVRWCQFSLSTLLALFLPFSVLLSWLAIEVKSEREQQFATERLVEMGSKVERQGWASFSGSRVSFAYDLDDHGLAKATEHLQSFPHLRLDLCKCRITDQGLASLRAVPDLEILSLPSNEGITDDGLATIRELESVRELELDGTSVTGGRLATLYGMPRLKGLGIDVSQLEEAGGWPELQALFPGAELWTVDIRLYPSRQCPQSSGSQR
jgi:hypothetical protein